MGSSLMRTASMAVIVPLTLYSLFLGLGMTTFFQRHFLYAHTLNTLPWADVNEPQRWGFAKNQVTPFTLDTPDGPSLYAWHVLPLPLYLKHETRLSAAPSGPAQDITTAESFKLLKSDAKSKLILYFHGNAGHVAHMWRADSFHALTGTSPYHVIAIDYRGFGHSTGSPTEDGLILDAEALVNWAVKVAGIPSSRIVLFGHSLGTAVASGVAERFTLKGVDFAGIVLVAGFGDLASMLSGYRMFGVIPVLGPLSSMPWLVEQFQSFIVDKWHSANRLANIVKHTKKRLRLHIIHALDDADIPWDQGNVLFQAAANATTKGLTKDEFADFKSLHTTYTGAGGFTSTVVARPGKTIRQHVIPHGGHNAVVSSSEVLLAVMRCFE